MESNCSIQLLPTESSCIAPFFLVFGHEAAVKHTLLASESPKYAGTDNSMINIEHMTKLYLVVAHNLNEARKARIGNKKKKHTAAPEQLKIGDNVLVRDHTSKAFQPKYKDFCIVGLLGKNQVEIKDNYRHTTKAHSRDMKKIPMIEKVCQLYEEEQIGKVRNGRKAVPSSKMPDLGWDATEEIETQRKEDKTTPTTESTQEIGETEATVHIVPEAIIAILVLILTFLETIKSHIEKIPEIWRKAAQVVTKMTRTTGRNRLSSLHRILNEKHHHTRNGTAKQNFNDGYDGSYKPYHTTTLHDNYDQ